MRFAKKFVVAAYFVAMVGSFGVAKAQSAGDDVKSAADKTGDATKTAAKDTGHATK